MNNKIAAHFSGHETFPFREAGIDKANVIDILENSGVGYPKYYEWRSRSGCTFCFFQQKIEWVRLREKHPGAYKAAKDLEKDALEHGSPFTWSKGESLSDMEQPGRIAEIEAEYKIRRERMLKAIPINPLRPVKACPDDIDDIYGVDEGNCAGPKCMSAKPTARTAPGTHAPIKSLKNLAIVSVASSIFIQRLLCPIVRNDTGSTSWPTCRYASAAANSA
jgi:hypothetical protein